MKKQMLLSVLLLAIFAVGILSIAVPVSADVSGDFTILFPEKVVPGGALLLGFDGMPTIEGGTTYFYLSDNSDPEISSGDIFIGDMDTDDVEDELEEWELVYDIYCLTLKIPEDVEPDEYYVKLTDRKRVDADAIASEEIDLVDELTEVEEIEVLEEEDWPTITVDPESDVVWLPWPDEEPNTVEVEGEDIDTDYEWVELCWDKYQGNATIPPYDYQGYMTDVEVVEGEFTAEDVELPEAYMGEHDILVLLMYVEDAEFHSLGTFVKFNVEPSIDVDPIDIEADVFADQDVDIYAHGFPEGTLAEDSIVFTVRDMEGDVEEVVDWVSHAEQDVSDEPPGTFGFDSGGPTGDREALTTTVDEVPKGLIDIDFEVNDEEFTLERQLLSSEASDPDEMEGTLDPTSGEIGDDVWFYVLQYPANVEVDIVFRSADVELSLIDPDDFGFTLSNSTDNGAWKFRWAVGVNATGDEVGLAGGEYTVEAWDLTNDEWEKIGEFEVLPTVKYYDEDWYEGLDDVDTTYVDDELWIRGTGFLNEAEFDTIVIGGEDIELDPTIEIGDDGVFYCDLYGDYDELVPHVSGGGEEVVVELKGEDAEGDALTVESSIIIDPRIEDIIDVLGEEDDVLGDEAGILALSEDGWWFNPFWNEWDDIDEPYDIFAGHPMKVTGVGFKAGESVKIMCIDEDADVEEEATITDGGTAESDGDLEVVFMLPHTKDFGKGMDELEIEVVGKATASTVDMAGFYDWEDAEYIEVDTINDDYALIFFGLEDDGSLDLDTYVGDSVRIVGVGFETDELIFEIEGEEVGEVDVEKYGFFDTTVEIPELQRSHFYDDEDYWVEETETGADSTYFSVLSKVVLSATRGVTGIEVTAIGTGFVEDADVCIVWPDLEALVEDIAPDEDGNWEETFTVPNVPPGTYSIEFDDEDLPWYPYDWREDDEVTWDDPEVTFFVLGPMKIASLTMPGTVYPESTIAISVTVQDYFGGAVAGAKVTGSITPPVGTKVTLTFPATDAVGISAASWTVPADAAEGTYLVDVTAEKAEAGAKATASGSFYVEIKVPPTPPVDLSALEKAVSDLSGDVSGLSGDLSKLAADVSGLKSDIAALEAAIAAIPIVPVEWIYITAIMAIIAAIAAIAAVVAVYRKIA